LRLPVCVLAAVLALDGAALAQIAAPGIPTTTQGARVPKTRDWTISLGFAPIYAPIWQGSRDQGLSVFPDLRINYRDALFFSVPDGLGWNAVNTNGWKIGPLFKFRFARDENTGGSPFLLSGSSDALIGMGTIGFVGEPGAFAQYTLPGNKVRLRAELRQGIGGHAGLIADTSIGYASRFGTPGTNGLWLYSASLRSTFAASNYTNTYFGVNAQQSLNTGLAVSELGSGLVSAGLNASLTKPLGKYGQNGAITLFGGYDRLSNVVGESSLLEERGRLDQLSIGLSYTYRFGLGGTR
jgi:outer membrane scaffolding protein for murein synthesis (MipA/OmpV family)